MQIFFSSSSLKLQTKPEKQTTTAEFFITTVALQSPIVANNHTKITPEEQFNFPLADIQKNLVKEQVENFSLQLNSLAVAVYLHTHTHCHST